MCNMRLLILGVTILVAVATARENIDVPEDIPMNGHEQEDVAEYQVPAVEQNTGLPLERRKIVKKQYKPWTSWSTWSVPKEHKFPDYNQFKLSGAKCPIGCGAVAWAMIFGYYDRLAPKYGYNPNLYRCGAKGLSGSSCEAPSKNNPKMKKYITYIAKKLKTFCLFGGGATTPKGMGRIQGFYRSRQGGKSKISSYKWAMSWTGWTRGWIRNRAKSAIKSGYPAIVGIWTSKAQHYPVATKYKTRTRKYRRCVKFFKWICGKWKLQREERFYLHMGWGGNKNGWWNINCFSAFVARK